MLALPNKIFFCLRGFSLMSYSVILKYAAVIISEAYCNPKQKTAVILSEAYCDPKQKLLSS